MKKKKGKKINKDENVSIDFQISLKIERIKDKKEFFFSLTDVTNI